MDLRQLEMVRAVAENSSFTLAGRQLNVAQSAISRKIKLLENELGEKLFRRVNKKVFLTPAGTVMLRYSDRIFQELRNASLEIADLRELNRGILRIGSGMTACIYLLPPVIEKFQKRFPKVDIQVQTAPADVLLPKVRDGALDVGVVTLPVNFPDLEVLPFAREEMVVVASPRNRKLAHRRTIRSAELASLRMILFNPGTTTRTLIDDYFRRIGIQPEVAMESENIASIRPLVRINLGVSILPLAAVADEAKRGELKYLRLADEPLTRDIGLVTHKSNYQPRLLLELISLFKTTLR
jgi:DNA-binding transcriptional LysR family regulator